LSPPAPSSAPTGCWTRSRPSTTSAATPRSPTASAASPPPAAWPRSTSATGSGRTWTRPRCWPTPRPCSARTPSGAGEREAGLGQCSGQEVRHAERGGPPVQVRPVERLALHLQHAEDVVPLPLGDLVAHPVPEQLVQHDVLGRAEHEGEGLGGAALGDRKSTRLNSSHVK